MAFSPFKSCDLAKQGVAQGQEAKVYGPAAVPVEKTRKIRPPRGEPGGVLSPLMGHKSPSNYPLVN